MMGRDLDIGYPPAVSFCVFTESHNPTFEVGKDYEVVRPVRLHAIRKRGTEVDLPTLISCRLILWYTFTSSECGFKNDKNKQKA